jgi:hypothetical protein
MRMHEEAQRIELHKVEEYEYERQAVIRRGGGGWVSG